MGTGPPSFRLAVPVSKSRRVIGRGRRIPVPVVMIGRQDECYTLMK